MISVVVPTLNEQENIKELLLSIHNAFNSKSQDYEVIVVDDHSTDNTWEILSGLVRQFPLRIFKKEGKKGKAYSLVEGFAKASGDTLAFIDADLQYPPEAISTIISSMKTSNIDVVVGNRKKHKSSKIRRMLSKTFRYGFGKVLFGLSCDIQSGLKVFRREVWETVKFKPRSAWSFDLDFLVRAKKAGFVISSFDIFFERRHAGKSSISVLANGFELAKNALILRTNKIHPQHIPAKNNSSMAGAGVGFEGQKYTTHTTLHHSKSAIINFTFWQKAFLLFTFALIAYGLYKTALFTAILLVGILSLVYFLDTIFNLFLVLNSLRKPPEIKFKIEDLSAIQDEKLPIYSILCPLYKEAHVLPGFLKAIEALDWPKKKLDVLLLLEEDDIESLQKIKQLELPSWVRTIIVPRSAPKTKPKACNYGLGFAKGEYIVIYDAEDIPDTQQLKKAYLAFSRIPREIACLQAKLNYYNSDQNLLTRLFTAEYSLWFDVTLTGLQSLGTSIPLGGTSNHFRTADLKLLEGWDPFNVTEDADLGVRLFKAGFKTAVIDSTTLEEANSRLGNWIRQRSRWVKGYMQTYLVHMRNPFKFVKNNGIHAFFFQLTVGGKIAFMFINPLLWAATISYFALNNLVGPTIESLYPSVIFYMAATSLVFGNFLFMYYYMIGCAKREQWSLIKYVFFVPFYWLLVSFSATIALYQLTFKPHYWEKTVHGFQILENQKRLSREQARLAGQEARAEKIRQIKNFAGSGAFSGGLLVAAAIIGNFFNFLYNAYLGRRISVEEFGLVSVVGSFLYLSSIPIGALGKTVTHRSAYLLGKYESSKHFWAKTRYHALLVSLATTVLWLVSIPILSAFFKSPFEPFIIFAPVWIIGVLYSVDTGFLTGSLKFKILALLIVTESALRFLFSLILVETKHTQFVYAAIPASITVSFLIGWVYARSVKESTPKVDKKVLLKFPRHFYLTSVLTKISTVAYLSFDVILAKHFLSPIEAGQYALLALIGKMIFFIGSLFSQFINPLVSREEGARRSSKNVFYRLIFLTALTSFGAYLAVGIFGKYSAPILFGNKVQPIIYLLPSYGFAMFCFSLASCFVTFYQVRRKYLLTLVSFLIALTQVVGITIHHQDLYQIVAVMNIIGVGSLITVILLHIIYKPLSVLAKNLVDLAGVITFPMPKAAASHYPRILIFNWRDIKHIWAGGAEVYIHEIARDFVKRGNLVTVFCGNDGNSASYEVIDGVQIIRRGGFYTVYLLAALYYIFKFRGRYDIIIDSENGIPFFTPLYARIPIIGLIHHVHQDIHRKHLSFPLSQIALFLEGKLMPQVYRNVKMVTISKSSKEAMQDLGFESQIEIVHPGVNLQQLKPGLKTKEPSVLYLGRLKPYKSIETAILAMVEVIKNVPNATLTIAGEGESRTSLEALVEKLGLNSVVRFMGKVSEIQKAHLFAQSWVMVQPSSMEGWGITAIEANACGTPVVAANVPGLRDSVLNPHTGYLVTCGDHIKFAQKIEKIIVDNKTRKELEKDSLQWANKFSWPKSAQQIAEIFTEELQRVSFKASRKLAFYSK